MSAAEDTPLRLLICAMGGEGGGVLMNWIVAAARAQGFTVQATSVPGVAQRTGSTSYYIEIAPPESRAVMSLVPMAGRVDVVVASELSEAGRAMEAGFVSPRLTTLIASTNRVLTTAEKAALGEGRFDSARLTEAAQAMARTAHLHDLAAIAEREGTFISATLFGALAASGALPLSREACEAVLGDGRAAEANRRGFAAGWSAVAGEDKAGETARASEPSAPVVAEPPAGTADWPEPLREVAALGHARLVEYQDAAYAALYLERVGRLAAAAAGGDHRHLNAVTEAARRLALWMAYEDIPRVAQLKTRPERFARIREEARMGRGDILHVTEYLRPRAEELADMLPAALGRRIMARVERGRGLPFLGRGVRLRSSGVLGFWLLRSLAAMRRLRRRSLRFARETSAIEEWLDAMHATLPAAPGLAEALAALPRLRKGYSDTLERGCRAYERIFTEVVRPALAYADPEAHAARLRGAIAAALADEEHRALDAFLAGECEARAAPPKLRAETVHVQ
ncbi:indolepyruvate ferredoxin oxidoreductase beta subunit [Meinhardsimonia xiamenensis]|jgi:indolepyruvate ferredoxin oxidoreductase beta subunit|uniref:Indolepyruvate ferredoxin oxidoreductase beta subunit n=1 Tax=Meinhardsimonia xiamenensis TaxID=990712 RepID=A0A1G9GE35_9RHOB|nr:indolepyruvate oxidoreductase subunit beta family protein [Meinhardsimonia xiamenensis]PRX31939.1 indolepyruvate ferredoxin oxidoreductase beta subunit [Meinhardsimonia xiamenensis]SDK98887.1 indolepyruvate ferredoxin oxidoreductase beta subunit [Meinhardsimonia xiamenensis]